jgi:glycosyltransferase involved in cell wall biosynthesis
VQIAVVHDHFTQVGDTEKFAAELVRMLPGANLHAAVALPDRMPPGLAGRQVKTSWMQHLPKIKEYDRLYSLLYPFAMRSRDLSRYDLVISSTSGYAKGIRTRRGAIHVCYCHSLMPLVWSDDKHLAGATMGTAKRLLLPPVIRALRRWDEGASRYPDHFIASSRMVAAGIERAYGRTAEVIHPPIDVNRFHPSPEQEDYYLVLARLVPSNRIDLAIEACSLVGRRLVVIGEGRDRARLIAKAGPTVKFLTQPSDDEVEHYAARCRALIIPGAEGFGMAPLEIAAAGRPTIAYRDGRAVETIIDGVTGSFFDRQEPGELARSIRRFERQEWSAKVLRRHAEGFGIDIFQSRFLQFLARVGAPLHKNALLPFATPATTHTYEPHVAGMAESVPALSAH